MSTWPDPLDTVQTTNMDESTVDLLADAMTDIKKLTDIVNQILGTMANASTPWTDINGGTIMKAVAGDPASKLAIYNATGHVISSGVSRSTDVTLGGGSPSDLLIPSQGAVKTFGGTLSSNDWSLHRTLDLTTSIEIVDIPLNVTAFKLLFQDAQHGLSTTKNIHFEIGHSGGYYHSSNVVSGELTSSVNLQPDVSGAWLIAENVYSSEQMNGTIDIYRANLTSHSWVGQGTLNLTSTDTRLCAGYISSLSDLSRFRLLTDRTTSLWDSGYLHFFIRY